MRIFALLALIGIACSSLVQAQTNSRWKVVVIVPERHLTIRQIPDPAVETEINRQLIAAGFRAIDPSRASTLIAQQVQDRRMRKDAMSAAEAQRLGRKVGANVVVTGEAFTTRVAGGPVQTDIGTVNRTFCQARVELKAYLVDTGELLFSDAITKVGAPELSEEAASKTALQDAAEEIGPRVIAALSKPASASTYMVSVEVRNVTYSQGIQLREALRKAAQATEISEGDFDAKTWSFEVTVPKAVFPRVASNFEASPSMKRLKLVIQQANKTKIVMNRKG